MDSDLAKFRAEKGISLHEISTKLNIPDKFLLAIEELNFDELPAPIFAKSQIKKYCSFYDQEPSIILEKYENEAHQKPVGNMSPDEINIFLEKGYTLRLSCLKPNWDPFIVPCCHHWEKNNEKSTEEKSYLVDIDTKVPTNYTQINEKYLIKLGSYGLFNRLNILKNIEKPLE